MILVCAATAFEIAPTLNYLEKHPLSGLEVLITGVGLTAATYALTRAVYRHQPTLLIQAGIAGAFSQTFPLGSTALVVTESIGDLGVTESGTFRSLFDLGLLHQNEHPWQDGRLVNPDRTLSRYGLPLVNGVTIQEITTGAERARFYKEQLGAEVESMEGAALHYVGLMENVPFLQLRAVSNYVGERDKSAWKIRESVQSLNTELQQLIAKLMIP